MALNLYVALAVAITLIVNSVHCASLTEVINPRLEDDFIYGSLQENSVLLHTYHSRIGGVSGEFATDFLYWNTRSTVHHVFASDQSGNQTGGTIVDYDIADNHVILVILSNEEGGSINISVQISGELAPPANFFLGQLSERSVLAQTVHLNRSVAPDEYSFDAVTFSGNNISRVEARDLSIDANGGFVEFVSGGVGYDYITIFFAGNGRGSAANFEIKFFVDVFRVLEIGNRYDYTGRNIMVLNERLTETGVDGEIVNATFQFGPSNFSIRSIGAYDRTSAGNGGWLNNLTGGLDQTHLTLDFTSEEIGLGIDFSVVIFGVSTINANHFIRGNFYSGDMLLYSEHLLIAADPDTIVFGRVEFNATGDQYIYLVQGIDQATDGYGGILNMIEGGPFSESVTLGFQSVGINLGIDFVIQIYGSGGQA